jgi:hypothetical protein
MRSAPLESGLQFFFNKREICCQSSADSSSQTHSLGLEFTLQCNNKASTRLINLYNCATRPQTFNSNTAIPDKDLAIVPPRLLPTMLTRPDATPQSPSTGPVFKQQLGEFLTACFWLNFATRPMGARSPFMVTTLTTEN